MSVIVNANSPETVYWFDGVSYTASDRAPLVDHLMANPELVGVYTDKMIEVHQGLFGWGAFDMAKEGFIVLCDVLADIAERQGRMFRR